MGWFLLGLGIGIGLALGNFGWRWVRTALMVIRANRDLGWDVNWLNWQDGMNWKRLDGR